ncbi:hypothetical protein [Winogradskyella ursingii]|uniref:hypothetical protein n=1 Tax=Winogradskyella ursingii TaxID=2686079 RepID=UPI0015CB5D0E|nr:hypothetical protein [Winogradskyella ursingii]
MKTTKRKTISTDYFFEALYKRAKTFLFSNVPSKLATLKVLAIIAWIKDIN